jgi:aryl-alcohol dehydrogenase-like predicted oxidoreductase
MPSKSKIYCLSSSFNSAVDLPTISSINMLAVAWLMAQPQVCSVITGATRLEHVLHNVQAASWALTSAEVDEVNALLP